MWISVAQALLPAQSFYGACGWVHSEEWLCCRPLRGSLFMAHSSCRRWPDQAVSCASRVRALCAVHIALAHRAALAGERCVGDLEPSWNSVGTRPIP